MLYVFWKIQILPTQRKPIAANNLSNAPSQTWHEIRNTRAEAMTEAEECEQNPAYCRFHPYGRHQRFVRSLMATVRKDVFDIVSREL